MKTITEYLNNNDEIFTEAEGISGIAIKDLKKDDYIYLVDLAKAKTWGDAIILKDKVISVSVGTDDTSNDYFTVGGLVIKTAEFPKGIDEPLYLPASWGDKVADYDARNFIVGTSLEAVHYMAQKIWDTAKKAEEAYKKWAATVKPVKITDADRYKAEYDRLVDEYDHENGQEMDEIMNKKFLQDVAKLKAKYNIK